MPTPPDFTSGSVLTAAQMNAVGLWLVKTQTIGTGVSSVTVTGAFSSDYDVYLVTIVGGSASANTALGIQMGATTSGYAYSLLYTSYTNTAAAVGTGSGSSFLYAGGGTTSSLRMACTITAPYLTEQTDFHGSSTNGSFSGVCAGYLNDTTSYTDFTVVTQGVTMTGGTIRVYGYRN